MSLFNHFKPFGTDALTLVGAVGASIGVVTGITPLIYGGLTAVCIAGVLSIYQRVQRRDELHRTIEICQAVGNGDFECRVTRITDPGQIGRLQHAVNALVDRCDAYVRESVACLDHVAHNKYYRGINPVGMHGSFAAAAKTINTATDHFKDKVDGFGQLTTKFEDLFGDASHHLSESAGGLKSTAIDMDAAAKDTTQRAVAVASAIDQTASNVQLVAAASEELSASVTAIRDQVGRSTHMASAAVEVSKRTDIEVNGLLEAVETVSEAVSLISAIAHQTNMLALNATVESERAGEAGRGFAVVAGEIKGLAAQTATATHQIEGEIDRMREATHSTVGAIRDIAHSIQQINVVASEINLAVDEQAAATSEISSNIQMAYTGARDVSDNIQVVAERAQSTLQAADTVLSSANDVAGSSGSLEYEVSDFLQQLRRVI